MTSGMLERHLLYVANGEPSARDYQKELQKLGLKVTTLSTLKVASTFLRDNRVHAIVHHGPKQTPMRDDQGELSKFSSLLRMSSKRPLIYAVNQPPKITLDDLIEDRIEGFFEAPPTPERLSRTIESSLSLRKSQNRRSTPRYPHEMTCMLKAVGLSGLAVGQLVHIGSGGFQAEIEVPHASSLAESMIQIEESFQPSRAVRFSVLDQRTSENFAIEGEGEVRWHATRDPNRVTSMQVGIRFQKASDESVKRIFSLLNEIRTT